MKKYTKEIKVHPCRLTNQDLLLLEKIILTEINEKRIDRRVSSVLEHVNISENNISDFLKHKDLPKVISRLSLSVIGSSDDGQINKSVSLTFYDNFINLEVEGESENWVKGKFAQITDCLKTKRAHLWFLKTTPVYMLRGAVFIFLLVGWGIVIKRILSESFDSVGILLPTILFIGSLFDQVLSRFKHVEIYLEERKSFIEKYKTLFAIITVLAAIFTIIEVIKGLLK